MVFQVLELASECKYSAYYAVCTRLLTLPRPRNLPYRFFPRYCSFAYSALATSSRGNPGSASFQVTRKSW